MSAKRTTAASAAKGKAAPKRRASGTDWTRLRSMTDAEAARGASDDRENPPATAAWLAGGQLIEPVRKRAISLRLDPEVIDWFRETGPRYQSRMNAVLRAFVQHQRQNDGPPAKRKRVG
jgi:uncharacterized protein (DUF4415 family)